MRGTAGPSSFPSEDNAIHKLMDLLDSMSARSFPAEDNPVASRFDELMREEIDDPFLRSFRDYNRRDTFILKKYDAGSQANVLPHEISFEAELQLVPSRTREYAEQVLTEVFAKVDAEWEVTGFRDGFASDLSNGAFASLARSTAAHFDGAQLLPVYALGQTDGRFLGALGCDVYGFAPVTRDIPFSEVLTLVHQNNEKVSRDSITTGAQILEQLIRDIGQVSV
jgi:acetylornithine deacetylase/succinyl-diaminopimelate desuccinylase-like protein